MTGRFRTNLLLSAILMAAAAITSLAAEELTLEKAAQQPEISARATKQTDTGRTGRRNVLLITIDTLRADHLGCYGYNGVRTPTIDGLARDGIIFQRAIAQVPLTLPSHAAILTGTYPFHNGVQDFTSQPLSSKERTVAQAMHDHGYATGAVISSFVLDRSWGLARGFDFYNDAFSSRSYLENNPALVERKAGPSVTSALHWLEQRRARPFFFWLHLYDPHSPYDPPEPFRAEYHDHLYDGEIAYADSQIARVVGWLKKIGQYRRTWIVLLSDHGESLGEHGEKEHGFFVYNSTVHVPLIIKPADNSGLALRTVATPVETIQVAPTLLQATGISDPIQKQFDSGGLFNRGENAVKTAAYSETFYAFSSFGWSPLHGLETDKYHYIYAPKPELYALDKDPKEDQNVVAQQNAVASVMKGEVERKFKEYTENAQQTSKPVDETAAAKLRALGYLAYRAPVSAETLNHPLSDPKDKLEEFNAILRATDAVETGHFEEGEALLSKLSQSDPTIYIVPFMLGESASRQQKWANAATNFQNCLKLNPDFDQAMTGLARALQAQGQLKEAGGWLNRALQRNPQNFRALYQLAWLKESSEGPAAAAATFERVLAIQPTFALAYRDLGMLRFRNQEYAPAANNLQKAADLGLQESALFNFLGISYSRTKRLSAALHSYQQALKVDPNYAEAHLNLGLVYQRLNKAKSARQEYDTACQLQQKFCQLVPKSRP